MSEAETPSPQTGSGITADGSPQRWFWRRALAFAIDYILLAVAVAVIALALSSVLPFKFTGSALNFTHCLIGETPPPQAESAFPVREGEERYYIVCDVVSDLVLEHRIHRIGVSRTTADGKNLHFFVEYVSDDGVNEQLVLSTSLIVSWLFPLFMAAMTAYTGYSPGKRLLKLQVLDTRGDLPGFGRALGREMLKLAPLILLTALTAMRAVSLNMTSFAEKAVMVRKLADGIGDGADLSSLGLFSGSFTLISVALAIVGLIWWFAPFIVWRGATFYDRIMHTRVSH